MYDPAALSYISSTDYSAVNMHVSFRYPHQAPVHAGNLKTLSISTHRDVFPVMGLGSVRPRGFTRGPRTVAGTLVFSIVNVNPVPIMVSAFNEHNQGGLFNASPDQYPPFDIDILHVNNSGVASVEGLRGVVLLDMGKVISVENILIDEQYSYMAENYVPLTTLLGSEITLDRKVSSLNQSNDFALSLSERAMIGVLNSSN